MGETVLTSGVYEVLDENGTVLSRLPLAKGDHLLLSNHRGEHC